MLDKLIRLAVSCVWSRNTNSRKADTVIEKPPLLVKRYCAWCKNPYMAKRSDSKFCSDRCRQLSARWRRRLPALEEQVNLAISAIGVYMQYNDTRQPARQTLYRIIAKAQTASQKRKQAT